MIEYHLRAVLQPTFNYVGSLLGRISPNSITAVAFLSGIMAAGCVAYDQPFAGIFFLSISGICDILDGTVARLTNQASPTGAYIDLISDRMVEAAIILGFTFLYPQYYLTYILFLIALLLHFSTFVAAGALFKNDGPKSMHHDHSVIERAEAFIVFGIMMLFPDYLFLALTLFSVAILADAIGRFFRVIRVRNPSTSSGRTE